MSKLVVFFLIVGWARVYGQPSFLYPTTIPVGAPITSIIGGDFNGDGIGDIAVSYETGVATFLGNPDGTFTRKNFANLPAGFSVRYFLPATDINADHRLDLIGMGSSGFFVMYGNGDGTFQPPVFPSLATDGVFGIADFNGDGIPDLLVRVNPSFATELGNGDGTFKGLGPLAGILGYGWGFPTNSVIADFDGDGLADFAVTQEGDAAPFVFLGNGDGSFRPFGTTVPLFLPGSILQPMAAGDVNGDGKKDIVEQANGLWVLLGDGAGGFQVSGNSNVLTTPRPSFPSPLFVGSVDQTQVALADFDGDRKLDFASCFYVYPGNGDGTFRAPIYFGQMGNANSSVSNPFFSPVIDVNGDGKPDIIGIGPDGQSISVLINSSGTPVASAPAYLAQTGDIVVAPGALASVFGAGLSSVTASATEPLPSSIGNTSVELVDSAGTTFLVPLLYVSATQINFQVPDDAAAGLAIINVMGTGLPKGAHSTYVQPIATALFTLDGTGKGAPVSSALSVDASGSHSAIPTVSCTPVGICTGLPIAVGSGGQVYLSLYGTGFRHATVGQCMVGGIAVTPSYFGPQGPGALVDQVNIPMPGNTAKGAVDISCQFALTGSGITYNYGNGNTVTITIE